MICSECHGTGKSVYLVEVDRDENSVTCEKREGICRTCNGSGEKPMTNGDRIRAMSDEELYEVIMCPKEMGADIDLCNGSSCEECCLKWLNQPAEDE